MEKLSKQANDEFLDGFFKNQSKVCWDMIYTQAIHCKAKGKRGRPGVKQRCRLYSGHLQHQKFEGPLYRKDSISGDKLSPVDKVISAIGIASGPGKKAGVILKGIFNGGKKLLKKFGVYIDDLAERFGFGPKLQPAGGPRTFPGDLR